jgi:branched-chain amino acid aminotransferase
MEKTRNIWLDGSLVAWDAAQTHVLTHGLHYGLGVFEGIRAYKTEDGRSAFFRLREHLQRLLGSAHILLMEVPYTVDALEKACLELLRSNGLPEGYVRPLAYSGYGNLGVGAINDTHVAIAVWPWGAYLSEDGLAKGIRAKVSSFTRTHVNVNMVRAKVTGQYVNSILANREATLAGYQEAILLDTEGYVAEGSGENIFIVQGGVLQTPPLSSPVLAGITRESVLRIAKDFGIPVLEQKFTRDTMYIADELFMTGTAAEVTPVREVDNRRIGTGKPGPITQRIQDTYFKAVHGGEPRYRDWLTYI